MNLLRIGLLIVLACLGPALPSRAASTQHFVVEEAHFECTVPADWVVNRVDSPAFSFTAVDPKFPESGMFVVFAKVEGTENIASPQFQNSYKDALRQGGFQIVREDLRPFKGYPAYTCVLRMVRNGKTEETCSINFVAGTIHYCINVRQGGSDRAPVAEAQKVLASFKILPAR